MHEQTIYFGAPGTGKSHFVNDLLSSVPKKNVFRVTIFPEYTYSDFVGQLLPRPSSSAGVDFFFHEGPFVQALKQAFMDNSENVYLVLEEISRGDIAAIFGDLFQLLDRNEYFVSQFPIRNNDISERIPQLRDGAEVYLPANFSIICTVNTSDQGVFPMDTAFKRRFNWVYMSTEPATKNGSTVIDCSLNNPLIRIRSEGGNIIETNWLSFYRSLNRFITDKNSGLGQKEDKQLGQFFLRFSDDLVRDSYSKEASVSTNAFIKIESIIKNKLLIYLWQDVQPVVAFRTAKGLFAPTIADFNSLYFGYENSQVFSNDFINGFLIPNKDLFPYNI